MRITPLVALLFLACSGNGVTGAAPERTIINGRFDTKTNPDCSVSGSAVGIGKFSADSPISVYDGSQGDNGVNHIVCRVHDAGNNTFDVEGSVKSDDRLLFAITGTFPTTRDPKGFAAKTATLSNGLATDAFAAFTEADNGCNVIYATDQQGTTKGRVWAQVTCSKATKDPTIGGKANGTCTTITEFRFEDCATD